MVGKADIRGDDRGAFMRLFCMPSMTAADITTGCGPWTVQQINRSITRDAGTVRGLHFQRQPALEAKIVRCLRGRVFDVAVDLRPQSSTYLRHFSLELRGDENTALFIPAGFAHGFQTLVDDCEMLYLHSTPYAPAAEGGIRHDDPRLGIAWPLPVTTLSPRDAAFAPIDESFAGVPL